MLKGFDIVPAQALYALGVALGGVHTLSFAPPVQLLERLPEGRAPQGRPTGGHQVLAQLVERSIGLDRHIAGEALAVRFVQAGGGAAALGQGRAAPEPLVRWRLTSFSTNDTDTAKRPATYAILTSPAAYAVTTRARKSSK
ncbi:MAG: hypothetical protein NVS3B25_23050 [Hymenobacter sp.]